MSVPNEPLGTREKPRLLDLFCGAGGCAKGYQRAGFHVVGVDHKPQPNYCGDEFYEADVLAVLRDEVWLTDCYGKFDAIHASPPCQHYAASTAWLGSRDNHPDLIAPVRELLEEIALPYVIENVPDARSEMRRPITLCGEWFGLPVRRHRLFEAGGAFTLRPFVARCKHVNLLPFEHKQERAYADALGCYWMSSIEARQAVPPPYTEFIGHQLVAHVSVSRVAGAAA